MLGSQVLLIPGIFLLAFGFTLQAGATGAVRAVKLSSVLTAQAIHERPQAQEAEPVGPDRGAKAEPSPAPVSRAGEG